MRKFTFRATFVILPCLRVRLRFIISVCRATGAKIRDPGSVGESLQVQSQARCFALCPLLAYLQYLSNPSSSALRRATSSG